jgi:asparagine synthetase B (glutamine-hydrolysing)
VDGRDLLEQLPKLLAYHNEPFVNLQAYAHFKLIEHARHDGMKIVVMGQGADELFGGYPGLWTSAGNRACRT